MTPSQGVPAASGIARRLGELPESVSGDLVHDVDRSAVSVVIPAIKRLQRAGSLRARPGGITVLG